MKSFVRSWLINAVGVLIAAEMVKGIDFTPKGLVLATLVLGILNAVVRPILIILSLPLMVLSLGFFLMVINALLLWWVGSFFKDFHVASFGAAFWGALIISIVSMVLNYLWKSPDNPPRRRQTPPPPPPPPRSDDGQGPVIDV